MNGFRIWTLGFMCLVAAAGSLSAQPAAPALPPGVKSLRDLAYVPHGHERQKLDLYLPTKAAGPLPVVVWIHGGAWLGGSKNFCPAVPFTTQRYAAASIN